MLLQANFKKQSSSMEKLPELAVLQQQQQQQQQSGGGGGGGDDGDDDSYDDEFEYSDDFEED